MFGINVLVCPQCADLRRVLAAIHDPATIARVLGVLGLTGAGSDPSGCQAPPAAQGEAADKMCTKFTDAERAYQKRRAAIPASAHPAAPLAS
ncbi:MAG: hypothetical protein ACK52I_03185 [Pseudomonadota bacterium]